MAGGAGGFSVREPAAELQSYFCQTADSISGAVKATASATPASARGASIASSAGPRDAEPAARRGRGAGRVRGPGTAVSRPDRQAIAADHAELAKAAAPPFHSGMETPRTVENPETNPYRGRIRNEGGTCRN